MSLSRHGFANIVPIDESKLGTKVYSASQVTNMIKANTNTARPKRFPFGVSAYYRVSSGLLNDYAIIIRSSAADSIAAIFASGQVLDGGGSNDEFDQILFGGSAFSEFTSVLVGGTA